MPRTEPGAGPGSPDRATGGLGLAPSRRDVVRIGFGAVLHSAFGCASLSAGAENGRLTARQRAPTAAPTIGMSSLGLGSGRDGRLYVPASYRADTPARLMVLFHGAGRAGSEMADAFRPLADQHGFVILAPDSRGSTWDVIRDGFGPDVVFLDRALNAVFDRVAIDPARIVSGGFSDGATYAISLGITNGDFFGRLLAFSPGFYLFKEVHGKPPIFVSHGTLDSILGIDLTSRRIVPELRGAGYQVEYVEFQGGHTIPPAIADQAIAWLGA